MTGPDAQHAGWARVHLDTSDAHDKTELMERLARDLDLPTWFGRNWDALADCLTDIRVEPGLVVTWTGSEDLPDALRRPLTEILEERAEVGPTPFRVVRTDPAEGADDRSLE